MDILKLFIFNCHSLSCKNEFTLKLLLAFHNGTKTKEQSQQTKGELIGKAMYAESSYVRSGLSQNWVEYLT